MDVDNVKQRVFGWDKRDVFLLSIFVFLSLGIFGLIIGMFVGSLVSANLSGILAVIFGLGLPFGYLFEVVYPRTGRNVIVTNSEITIVNPFIPFLKPSTIFWSDFDKIEPQNPPSPMREDWRLITNSGKKILVYGFIKDLSVLLEIIQNKGTNLWPQEGPAKKKIPLWQYLLFGFAFPILIFLGLILWGCQRNSCPGVRQFLQSYQR